MEISPGWTPATIAEMADYLSQFTTEGPYTMPEFQLDLGDRQSAARYHALDSFTQGYIQAMFFCSVGGDLAALSEDDTGFGDLAPATLDKIQADCAAFQEANAGALEAAYAHPEVTYDDERAGADFWYTRNGHGTGYWDRELGEPGDQLNAATKHKWGELELYRGDDGLLYLD